MSQKIVSSPDNFLGPPPPHFAPLGGGGGGGYKTLNMGQSQSLIRQSFNY